MRLPTMVKVESSNIDAIGHGDEHGLFVRFKSGALYSYKEAPRSLYHEMLEAPSAGQFFRVKVRGHYKHAQHDR